MTQTNVSQKSERDSPAVDEISLAAKLLRPLQQRKGEKGAGRWQRQTLGFSSSSAFLFSASSSALSSVQSGERRRFRIQREQLLMAREPSLLSAQRTPCRHPQAYESNNEKNILSASNFISAPPSHPLPFLKCTTIFVKLCFSRIVLDRILNTLLKVQ